MLVSARPTMMERKAMRYSSWLMGDRRSCLRLLGRADHRTGRAQWKASDARSDLQTSQEATSLAGRRPPPARLPWSHPGPIGFSHGLFEGRPQARRRTPSLHAPCRLCRWNPGLNPVAQVPGRPVPDWSPDAHVPRSEPSANPVRKPPVPRIHSRCCWRRRRGASPPILRAPLLRPRSGAGPP